MNRQNVLRTTLLRVVLLVVIMVPQHTGAQSLLWSISGKGLPASSYIYGTIHIKDRRVFRFDEAVLSSMEKCSGFAMEVELSSENMNSLAQSLVLPNGKTLQSIFTPEEYELIRNTIENETGMDMSLFDRLKPFALLSFALNSQLASEMEVTVDEWFYQGAQQRGKKISGLETMEEQMEILEKIPNEYIIDYFENINKGKEDLETIITLYCRADLNQLLKLMQKDRVMATLEQQLITCRNIKMADRIIPLINSQPTFIALGAGHLPGKKGIIRLLEKKGYSLSPVRLNKSACGG